MVPRASDRSFSRRDTAVLAGCVGTALIALFLSDATGQRLAASLRNTVLAPLVWLQTQAELGRTSRARFQVVTAERDSAALRAQQLPILRAENAQLRRLVALGARVPAGFVAAEVLHQAAVTDNRMLLVGVGTRDGVMAYQPVVAPEGLVGVVSSAGTGSASVQTWAHPEFRVSAFTADGRVAGIVAPYAGGDAGDVLLEFRAASYRDTLAPGTMVLSSGLGGVYPKGIPIGVVSGVAREQEGWERVYALQPAARPGAVTHVMILTGMRDSTLAVAFPSDSLLAARRADSLAAAAQADSARLARLADSVRALVIDSVRRSAPATPRRPPVAEPAP